MAHRAVSPLGERAQPSNTLMHIDSAKTIAPMKKYLWKSVEISYLAPGQPLVEALRRHVMSAQKVHADDTPVPVLAPGLGRTKLGRLCGPTCATTVL